MATKSQIEQKKRKELQKKEITKNNNIVETFSEAVLDMVVQEKESLTFNLEQRKNELISRLESRQLVVEAQDDLQIYGNSYPYQEVIDKMFKPILKFGCKEAKYSPNELYEVFDIFTQMCEQIKQVATTFTPTLDLFLYFSDISKYQYDKFRSNQDYAVVTSKINVYIGSLISDNSMKKNIDSRTGEFLQKADLGKRDRDEPITVIGNNVGIVDDGYLKKLRENINNI